MRALHLRASGEPPMLAELPLPDPGPGEVLVRVVAAGLNPLDNHIADGALEQMMEHRYPLVLGRDASGVVEIVGDGVRDIAVGDEVLAHISFTPPFQAGTIAEYAVMPAATVVAKPEGLDHVTASALPLAGGAAQLLVNSVGPFQGQVVLVNGASGGVGRFAVQLLAQRGVDVVATAAPSEADRLREMGAKHIVDYTAGPVAEQVLALYADGVDAMISLVGWTDADVPLEAVRRGGTVWTTTQVPGADTRAALGLVGGGIMASPTRDEIATLAEQAANGTLQVDIDRVLPLAGALDGLADLAAGRAHGKIVIDLSR